MASLIENFPKQQLEQTGDPISLRTVEAWWYSLAADLYGEQKKWIPPRHSEWVEGTPGGDAEGCGCLLSWEPTSRTLLLAFRGSLQLIMSNLAISTGRTRLSLAAPFYLAPFAPLLHQGPAKHGMFGKSSDQAPAVVSQFNDSLREMHAYIQETASRLMGDVTSPRHIRSCGFCSGGGLASIYAPCLRLIWPGADVDVVTFGSPKVGNKAFAELYTWLVGNQLRTVYRFDVVPDFPKPRNQLSVKLCGVGDELFYSGMGAPSYVRPGGPFTVHHTLSDHSNEAYMHGIRAAVCAAGNCPVPRSPSGHAMIVDPEVAQNEPELACHCPGGVCPCPETSGDDKHQPHAESSAVENFASIHDATDPAFQAIIQRTAEFGTVGHTIQKTANTTKKRAGLLNLSCFSSGGVCSCAGTDTRKNGSSEKHLPTGASQVYNAKRNGKEAVDFLEASEFWAEMRTQAELVTKASLDVIAFVEEYLKGRDPENVPPDVTEALERVMREKRGDQAVGDMLRSAASSYDDAGLRHGFESEIAAALPELQRASARDEAGRVGPHRRQGVRDENDDACGSGFWEVPVDAVVGGYHHDVDPVKMLAASRVLAPARYSYASYLTTAEEFSRATGLQNVTLVHDTSKRTAAVFVAWRSSGTAVLAFRGTARAGDWAADLKFLPRQVEFLPAIFPGASAHLGFLAYFNSISGQVATALEGLSGGRKPTRVVCCGHSLGGALATLGAAWAALQWPSSTVRCITFGAPRVGNARFVSAFSTLVSTRIRCIHGSDPIPGVPPAFRYAHIKPALFLKRGILETNPKLWKRRLALVFNDHYMQNYLESIKAVLHTTGLLLEDDSVGGDKDGSPRCLDEKEKDALQNKEDSEQQAEAKAVLGGAPMARWRCMLRV